MRSRPLYNARLSVACCEFNPHSFVPAPLEVKAISATASRFSITQPYALCSEGSPSTNRLLSSTKGMSLYASSLLS
jgi:hypothetical protein